MRERANGTWRLYVYVGLDSKGHRKYSTKTFKGTRRQAESALADFVTEVSKEGQVTSGPMSVEKVLHDWLKTRSARLEPATVERYRIAIDSHIVPAMGKLPVAKLRANRVEDLYTALGEEGQSGSSVRKVHGALRQALLWAKRRGYVAIIATDGVELPPMGGEPIHLPDTAHVRKLIDWAVNDDPDFGTLVAFVAATGCRRGEVCALRWKDVDLVKRSVFIREAVSVIPGGLRTKTTKTGESRALAIGTQTAELLRQQKLRCQERAAESECELEDDAHVFSPEADSSEPYHPQTVSHRFTAACTSAKVPVMRLHDLRHHSATTLLKNGASIGEVMDRHGWKSLAMVTRYRHFLDAKDRKAAEMLEEALGG